MRASNNLAIILPVYNPSSGWEHTLREHLNRLRATLTTDYAVMVVNDGSSINMKSKIEVLLHEYHELFYYEYDVNRGKGHALRMGVGSIDAENYILTDFDLPFGVSSIKQFSQQLQLMDHDVLLGKRSKEYFKGLPIKRRILSKLFNYFTIPLLGFKHYDTQTGIKAINEVGKKIFLQTKTDSYVYDFEFVKLAVKAGVLIKNIEVQPIESISFNNFGSKTMLKELGSLIRILIKS